MDKTNRDLQIIDLYVNHPEMTAKQIADQFNISTGTVSRIIRINNIPRRDGRSTGKNVGRQFSKDEVADIIRLYSQGVSKWNLQKQFNCNWQQVTKILEDNHVETISASKRNNPNLQENYFEKIDTPEKAYWLGWLITDGAVSRNDEKSKYDLQLTLQTSDVEILELFAQDLGAEQRVYSINGYCRFSLGCKKIVCDLEKWGIVQNKTWTVTFPQLDQELLPHLCRGLFDGDGGYSCYDRPLQHGRELSFCGNLQIVQGFADTLFKALPEISQNSITTENSIYRIRWGGLQDIISIRNYLYKDCGKHFLTRKFKKIYADTEVTN